MITRIYNQFMMWFYRTFLPDNCEICGGTNGGIRGNENIVAGIVMCDACSAWDMQYPEFWKYRGGQ